MGPVRTKRDSIALAVFIDGRRGAAGVGVDAERRAIECVSTRIQDRDARYVFEQADVWDGLSRLRNDSGLYCDQPWPVEPGLGFQSGSVSCLCLFCYPDPVARDPDLEIAAPASAHHYGVDLLGANPVGGSAGR